MKKTPLVLFFSVWLIVACDNNPQAETPAEPVSDVVEQMPESVEQVIEEPVVEQAVIEEPVVQAMSGEQVFKKHCFACHMTGAANAPKVGDVAAWEPRIAKGMDALLVSVIEGVPNTAMTAKGTCHACSEDELMASIEFMIDQSQ